MYNNLRDKIRHLYNPECVVDTNTGTLSSQEGLMENPDLSSLNRLAQQPT